MDKAWKFRARSPSDIDPSQLDSIVDAEQAALGPQPASLWARVLVRRPSSPGS